MQYNCHKWINVNWANADETKVIPDNVEADFEVFERSLKII